MNRLLLTVLLLLVASSVVHGEPRTRVMVNGEPAPVFFNDGDSFRVLDGKLEGTKARLMGFNTLESFGPVHQWGSWTHKELYVVAKMATLNGRRGVWRCDSDLNRDTYGRALFDCPKLVLDQLRKGLAHTMTVTADSAPEPLLNAQKEAIDAGRGIWAHGTPAWILTSLHSADENPDYPTAYNRVVSTLDGHSEKWMHTERYKECQEICVNDAVLSDATVAYSAQALDGIDDIRDIWEPLGTLDRHLVFRVWMMMGSVAAVVPKSHRDLFAEHLAALVDQGTLKAEDRPVASCMVYTDFRRRFGGGKAECLK